MKTKNNRFQNLETENEYTLSCLQTWGLYFIGLSAAIYFGTKYSVDDFSLIQSLNRSRTPYSCIKYVDASSDGEYLVKYTIAVEFIFEETKNNVKNNLLFHVSNGGFSFNIQGKNAKEFHEEYDDNLTHPDESEKYGGSLLLFKPDLKKKQAKFEFTFSFPFYGPVVTHVSMFNQQISRNFSFSLKRIVDMTTSINCSYSEGKRICTLHNVCVYDNTIETIDNYQLHANLSYLPNKINYLSRVGAVLTKKTLLNLRYKIAVMTDKGDAFSTLLDCFSQLTNDFNRKCIIMDTTKMINDLDIGSFIQVPVVGSKRQCYETVVLSEERTDPMIHMSKLLLNEKKEKKALVMNTLYQDIKDIDPLFDPILDQCPRCDITGFNPDVKFTNFLKETKRAMYIVGIHKDEMISAYFSNTTLIDFVPKGLKCSNWIDTATDYGLRAVKVLINATHKCGGLTCKMCQVPQIQKLKINYDLFGEGIDLLNNRRNPPKLITIDLVNEKISVKE